MLSLILREKKGRVVLVRSHSKVKLRKSRQASFIANETDSVSWLSYDQGFFSRQKPLLINILAGGMHELFPLCNCRTINRMKTRWWGKCTLTSDIRSFSLLRAAKPLDPSSNCRSTWSSRTPTSAQRIEQHW